MVFYSLVFGSGCGAGQFGVHMHAGYDYWVCVYSLCGNVAILDLQTCILIRYGAWERLLCVFKNK